MRSWRVTSRATAGSTSAVADGGERCLGDGPQARCSVLLGNGDGTFQPQVTYAVGSDPDAIVAGDFTGDGRLDLAVYRRGPASRYSWATATAPSSPR